MPEVGLDEEIDQSYYCIAIVERNSQYSAVFGIHNRIPENAGRVVARVNDVPASLLGKSRIPYDVIEEIREHGEEGAQRRLEIKVGDLSPTFGLL